MIQPVQMGYFIYASEASGPQRAKRVTASEASGPQKGQNGFGRKFLIMWIWATVCFINWNGCWRLTLFITSESSYEIANNISSSLRYINFKIIVL